jgi:hypothetical protein
MIDTVLDVEVRMAVDIAVDKSGGWEGLGREREEGWRLTMRLTRWR